MIILASLYKLFNEEISIVITCVVLVCIASHNGYVVESIFFFEYSAFNHGLKYTSDMQ